MAGSDSVKSEESGTSKIREIALLPMPRSVSYSVLGIYLVLTAGFIWQTFSATQEWVSHKEVVMHRPRVFTSDIEWTEIQLQLLALSAVAASVFLTLSVKLFTRIRSDGSNISLNLLSTLLLASPLLLFFLSQPWSSLLPAVMVASTILIDEWIMRKAR